MRLLVLNPNTTAAMTAQVAAEAGRLSGGRVALRCATAAEGPPVIASRESFVAGARAALQTWRRHDDGWAEAVLLACFGDPGLEDLRAACPVPVLGMAESSIAAALRRGGPFHIVTAGAAWDAMLRETVQAHPGAQERLDGITVLQTTGLAVARDPGAFTVRVQAALDALQARGAPTCILGGAGFAGMARQLRYPGLLTDGIRSALEQLLPHAGPAR